MTFPLSDLLLWGSMQFRGKDSKKIITRTKLKRNETSLFLAKMNVELIKKQNTGTSSNYKERKCVKIQNVMNRYLNNNT